MIGPDEELAALRARLAAGPSTNHAETQHRIAKPMYILAVDDTDLDERSIILIIRTGSDGLVRGMIALPQWHEIPEIWDGPHDIADAIRLADDYAWEYGFHGVAIDIESSQLWEDAWGKLETGSDL